MLTLDAIHEMVDQVPQEKWEELNQVIQKMISQKKDEQKSANFHNQWEKLYSNPIHIKGDVAIPSRDERNAR